MPSSTGACRVLAAELKRTLKRGSADQLHETKVHLKLALSLSCSWGPLKEMTVNDDQKPSISVDQETSMATDPKLSLIGRRSTIAGVGSIVAGPLLAPFARAQPARNNSKVVFGIGLSAVFLPYIPWIDKGFAAKHGVNGEYKIFESGLGGVLPNRHRCWIQSKKWNTTSACRAIRLSNLMKIIADLT